MGLVMLWSFSWQLGCRHARKGTTDPTNDGGGGCEFSKKRSRARQVTGESSSACESLMPKVSRDPQLLRRDHDVMLTYCTGG